MSLPPETIKLISDFLAAVGNLLYVLGGYYLGKWESDKSELSVLEKVEEVGKKIREEHIKKKLDEVEPPFERVLDQAMQELAKAMIEDFQFLRRKWKMERAAPRSLRLGVACLIVGSFLFVVRLMI